MDQQRENAEKSRFQVTVHTSENLVNHMTCHISHQKVIHKARMITYEVLWAKKF